MIDPSPPTNNKLLPFTDTTKLAIFGWLLSATVALIAIIAWGNYHAWDLLHLSLYAIFPIFGLLAFSIMWSQYVVAAISDLQHLEGGLLARYFQTAGWTVLVAILLHPGLLSFQLWRDGFGLPPESYLEHFVMPTLKWVALLGTTSLLIFLAFELHRFFGHHRWWRFVNYASDAAMLAVFYHGLRLGDQLQRGWFRIVWLFYGITLIISLAILYYGRFRTRSPERQQPSVI